MLADAQVMAVVATTDTDRARSFYGDTLGLRAPEEPMPEAGALVFTCGGGSQLLVYGRETAGDSAATAAGFRVQDVRATVEALRERGVTFEDYDFGNIRTTDGIVSMDGFQSAWFKDPDGNIISISN